jgi:hypothetical protein
MNFGNYFIGVFVGLTYFNFKKENKNISKSFVSFDLEAFKKFAGALKCF